MFVLGQNTSKNNVFRRSGKIDGHVIMVLIKGQTRPLRLRKRGSDKESTVRAAYHGNKTLTPPNASMNYDRLLAVYGLLFTFSFLSFF